MMSTMEEETVVDVQHDLEDGELSGSDADEVYVPLTRPENFAPHINPASIMSMTIQDDHYDDDSLEDSPSDSDSDSDHARTKPKKPKIKIKRHRKPDTLETPKVKKYSVWCKTVQEDTLTEDLVSCDVAKTKRYGIESYDHTILYRLNGNRPADDCKSNDDEREMVTERCNNKRSYKDRGNVKLRLGRRTSCDSDHEKGEMRSIPDLIVSNESPNEDVAKDIAEKLSEEKHTLILRTVENAGKQKAIDIFKETKRIEEDGGMMIMNGMRRRTPGGVFIFLLKRDKDVTQDMLKEIFLEDRQEANRQKRRVQQQHRNKKVEQLKQSLTDSALPSIRTRAEQWAAAAQRELAVEDANLHVSNPPPSPVTDGRECSSDVDSHFSPRSPVQAARVADPHLLDPRAALSTSYDEDYLDIGTNDDMDLF